MLKLKISKNDGFLKLKPDGTVKKDVTARKEMCPGGSFLGVHPPFA